MPCGPSLITHGNSELLTPNEEVSDSAFAGFSVQHHPAHVTKYLPVGREGSPATTTVAGLRPRRSGGADLIDYIRGGRGILSEGG